MKSYYRWWIMGLAAIGIIITYLDRMALSYAIQPLEQGFTLNNDDFGLIAAGFGVGYLLMTILGGILVDRYGARRIWSGSAGLWAIACIALGLATGFWWLLVFRVVLGIAEGPGFPALTRATADWLLPQEQGRAFALALMAVPLSSVIGAPVLSHLVIHIGWRWMFIAIGGLSLIWGLLWWLLFKDRPALQDKTNPIPTSTPWRFLLTNPTLLTNNIAFFAFGYVIFFALTWLPGYFEQVYHVKLQTIGWFLTIPWLTAAFMLLLGGFLTDWLHQTYHSLRIARSHLIWSCQLLSAACLLSVPFCHSPLAAIIGISFGLGFSMMPNAVYYAINTDLSKDKAATSLGLMDGAFALAGILAPYLTGKLTMLTGNFNCAIYLMAAITLIAALAVFLGQHPDRFALHNTSTR